MRDQLVQYVDLLFAGAAGAEDIKQEILQNTLDRYDDLLSQGKTPQAAYQLAISGIGDVNEILSSCQEAYTDAAPPAQPKVSYSENEESSADSGKRKLLKAIAIALFILCAIPVLILENSLGVCACLAMVAVGVAVLTVNGKEEEQTHSASAPAEVKHSRSAVNRGITGAIWCVGICGYFLLSFSTGLWHITWLVFPTLGCICGFVDACFDLSRKPVGAILRLILFLVLLGLLAASAIGLLFGSNLMTGISGEFNTSEGSVNAADIRQLEIEWVSGSITIQTADTDTITFTENYYADDAKPMVWKQSGDKLILQFQESGFSISLFGNNTVSKDLTVTVPADWSCDELSIDSVSAEINAAGLVCDTMDLNNVSGTCSFEDCMVQELELETVSGKVTYTGILDSLDCDSVSADCEIHAQNSPSQIDLDGVSCDLILYLPEGCGFTVDTDSASGDFESDFSTTSKNGKYIYGDGSCKISADSVSGDIIIRKAD